MAEIKGSEIVEKGFLKAATEEINLLIAGLTAVEQQATKTLESTKKIAQQSSTGKTTQDINNLSKAIKTVDEQEKLLITTRKQKAKLTAQIAQGTKKEIIEVQKLKVKNQELNKVRKQQARESLNLVGAYDRETLKLNVLRKSYKNLAIAGRENGKVARGLLQDITRLDTRLKKVDATTGQFQRNVGNYPKGFGRATSALRSFAGALGITAGLAGLVRALGNAIKIAKEFEQSNANLASVLGKTKEEIGALTSDAIRLGAATAFSASQVSGLQTEFAKLGFNEQEILNATEATLSLAAATGSNLAEAAAIAGATLGGFGLGADETQRVVDVMAKSFSTSALDIEKFRESMKDAAPAAKAVGVDVETTTALLGTLSNAGIAGSKAGTALKAGFIELNAAGIDLNEGLQLIANSEDKLSTATELVGKRAATSFLVLADGVDTTAELERGLRNAGGAAERMAKTQLDTLEGSLTILNSAWEGFVLGLLSGDSAFSSISRSIVETTTSLLGMLTPSQELADSWFRQRDEVEKLEREMNPLLDRYDELATSTELTKDEQVELDSIILQIAEDLPGAITEFDKFGKAMDVSTTAARKLIKQQKDLLALDNAEAIEEQQDAITGLNRDVKELNTTFETRNGVLLRINKNIKSGLKTSREATLAEIRQFQETGQALKDEIELREAKIAKLKGEKTEAELAAEAAEEAGKKGKEITEEEIVTLRLLNEQLSELKTLRKDLNIEDTEGLKNNKEEINDLQRQIDLIEGNTKARKKLKDEKEAGRRTDKEIQKERQARFDLEFDRQRKLEKEQEDRLKAAERRNLKAKDDAAIAARAKADRERKEELEKQRKQQEAIRELREQTASELDKAFSEEADKATEAANNEIETRKGTIKDLQRLAEEGNAQAAEQIAFEEQRLAQAELRKREIAEKEARAKRIIQLVDTYFTAFERRLADPDTNPNQAATQALADVGKGVAVSEAAKALAGASFAYTGTESVGGEGAIYDKGSGKDQYLYWLNKEERVLTNDQNGRVGNMSNEDLANLAYDYNTGKVGYKINDPSAFYNKRELIAVNSPDHSAEVSRKMDALTYGITENKKAITQAIKNIPGSRVNWDAHGNMVEEQIQNGMRKQITHKRNEPRL